MAVHATAPGPPVLVSDPHIGTLPEGRENGVSPSTLIPTAANTFETEESIRWREEVELQRKIERERLVLGLDNDDLSALLRSFDKHIHNVHISADPSMLPAALDIQPSPSEDFTLDKMRSNLERFYASVVIGLVRAAKEVQRIRIWEDGSRTAVALSVYGIAWYFGLIITTVLLVLSTLILVPSSREACFPPHTPQTGGDQADSSSGPSASEDKATEWASTVLDLITSLTVPAKGKGKGKGGAEQQFTEEVNGMIVRDMHKKKVDGIEDMSDKDKSIELYARPAMRIVGGLADKWERMANSLNPTPPFALEPHRGRVFGCLVAPLLALSTFVSARMFSRAFGLLFGFLLFGQPVIVRTVDELDRRYPHWVQNLIIECNILSDVPTNAQLVLRLLRDAEHRRRPLPHPPVKDDQEDEEEDDPAEGQGDGDGDDAELGRKMRVRNALLLAKGKVDNGIRGKVRRGWDKAGQIKEESFAWITGRKQPDYESKARIAFEKLHIPAESKLPSKVLHKLPDGTSDKYPDSASRFYVHHSKHGPGHILIHPPSGTRGTFTPGRLTFTTIRHVTAAENLSADPAQEATKGDLVVSVNDVVSLKKEGMGLPRRVLTSWALDTQGAGGTGLEIKIARRTSGDSLCADGVPRTSGTEQTIKLKNIVRRDELFCRLLAVGEQRWELS